MQAKLQDCLQFGVPAIWIIDPYSNQAWIATQTQPVTEVLDGLLRCENPNLEAALDEILPRD